MDIKEIRTLQALYKKKEEEGEKYIGMPTGYDMLDERLDGLWDGGIYVIAAAPSVGKSMFSLNIINNLLHNKKHVTLYSLEMNIVSLKLRLMGINMEVFDRTILKGFDDPVMIEKLNAFEEISKDFQFTIQDIIYEDNDLFADIYTQKEYGADIVFIDYIQNITSKDKENEYQILTNVCRQLQSIAKTINIPIVILSQVTKNFSSTSVMDIGAKGTGAIYEIADGYIELDANRDEVFTDDAQFKLSVDLKKNRIGGLIGRVIYSMTDSGLILNMPLADEPKKQATFGAAWNG